MESSFSPDELAYLERHKHESRVSEVYWVYIVPIVTGALSTALRFWAKRIGRNGITLDDYLITFATFCLIGECCSGLGYGAFHGMGRHVIVVSAYDQMMVQKGDYIFSHFYDLALVFVKLAILALYWRIFAHPVFRIAVMTTALFVIAWGIGITITLSLACTPLDAYWDSRVKGRCLQMVAFAYFTNISNLVTDIWIFLMPVPMIWHLQLQTKKKLMLIFIFCIGLATCVISSIRLTVVLGRGSLDFTWYYVPLGAYSVFEPLGGILCTNLPLIWPMIYNPQATSRAMGESRKTRESGTHTVGSASRRSRMIQALGITTADGPQRDGAKGNATEAADNTLGFHRLESVESQKPDPNIWIAVERLDSSNADVGSTVDEIELTPGMKKTNWHTRR